MGFIKLNVDAAFNQATGIVGMRGIFRDADGLFLGGFYHYANSIAFAKHGKLLALFFGLTMAQWRSFVPLKVESDCLDVVQAIKAVSPGFSEFGIFIDDLWLALSFSSAAICMM